MRRPVHVHVHVQAPQRTLPSPARLPLAPVLLLGLAGCPAPPHEPPPDEAPPHAHDLALPEEDLAGDTPLVGPERLSQTGLYADLAARTLAPGVLAFSPRYPLWSDGSNKERFLLLPPGQAIDTRDMDNWRFPVGTKAWKHFYVGGRLVETRLLWRARAGDYRGWYRVAYRWDKDGGDARAVPEGVSGVDGTAHDIPSQKDCDKCHAAASDGLLGVDALQLSAADGAGLLSQLARAGRLSAPPPGEFQVPGTGAAQAALGYLHANCGSSCHNDRHPRPEVRALRMDVRVADRTPEETAAHRTTLGALLRHQLPDGQTVVVVPGEPERSGLLTRMGLRDGGLWQMPPLGTRAVDPAGVAAVRAWIAGLR
jgi:hypothetical protein